MRLFEEKRLPGKKMLANGGSKGISTTACNSLLLASYLVVALLALGLDESTQVNCQEQLTVESRQQKDNDDLSETIKYLDRLDKYFSQIARPRFGRSEFKQPGLRSFGEQSALGSQALFNEQQPSRYNSLIELINGQLARNYHRNSY